MTVYLHLEDLLALVDEVGLGPMRDIGLLDSAAHRPQTSVFGDDAYPSLYEKGAVLLESSTRNQPLVDGNKRLGWVAMVVFFGLNGHVVRAPEDDAYDLVIRVATGAVRYPEAAKILSAWVSRRSD